jgi:hypothetical protein
LNRAIPNYEPVKFDFLGEDIIFIEKDRGKDSTKKKKENGLCFFMGPQKLLSMVLELY